MDKTIQFIDKAIDVAETALHWFLELLEALFYEKPKEVDTDFGNRSDVLSRWNNGKGICCDGKSSTNFATARENTLLVGGTGTGKSSVSIIPTGLHLDHCSVLIHTPSGMEYEKTAAHFKTKGFKIIVINVDNHTQSSRYNPLAHIKAGDTTAINSISRILVRASMGNGSNDPFWNLASESLLNLLIGITLELPKHLRHLGNVLHLLETLSHSPKEFDLFVAKYCTSEQLFSKYKSFIMQSAKLNSSIIANTKAALKIFESQDVAMTMSENDIVFEDLRRQKTAIFLVNNIAKQKLYGPASSIFFTQFFDFIFSKVPDKEKDLPIHVLLDEMSSLYIEEFSTYLSNTRKHDCAVCHAWQSLSQIKEIYGKKADAILANSRTQIYIPSGMDYTSAKELSERCGEFEREDEQKRKSIRKLVHPQELIQSEPDKGILLVGHHRPIQLQLLPYYKQRKLNKLSKIPPPTISERKTRKLPLFDFEELKTNNDV